MESGPRIETRCAGGIAGNIPRAVSEFLTKCEVFKLMGKILDDNRIRAARGWEALCYYVTGVGDAVGTDISDDEGLIDLLTDLRHTCLAEGIDFDRAVNISSLHYVAELNGL